MNWDLYPKLYCLEIDIAPNTQSFEVPLTIYKWTTRDIALLPLLTSLGIATSLGTGVLAISLFYYQSLSKDLADSLEEISQNIVSR